MRYVWPIALIANAVAPVSAQDVRHRIAIDAGELATALAQLSAQTGISLAMEGELPRHASRTIQGRMTVDEALARLLDPVGWEAVRVASRAYRLHPHAVVALAPVEPVPPDIVVTGRKRAEPASDIPGAVAVYRPARSGVMGISMTTREIARSVGGLILTEAGPGGERLFLRGVADSPFNGFSQSTVSVQLDDARIAFDGGDPGLRLVDVARVEVLKGPQGPLYGTGALGGVYRIVTNRPRLDRAGAELGVGGALVAGGGAGPQGQGVVNLPVIADRLGLRIVGYGAVDPGWIDDDDGRRDQNRVWTRGGRVALRAAPFGDWLVDVSANVQATDAHDTRYVDRPDSYTRHVATPEPYRGRFYSYQGAITGPVGDLRLTITTGWTAQDQSQRYDGTPSGREEPAAILNNRRLRVFDQEVRLASSPGQRVDWVAGASLLIAPSEFWVVEQTPDGIPTLSGAANRKVMEAALFADGSWTLTDRWRLGLGLRVFRADTENNSIGPEISAGRATTQVGVTPNVSLSYTPSTDRMVYARFATAYRPGGLDTGNSVSRRYDADSVRTLDFGGRAKLLGGRLGVDGNLFLTRWSDVQADYVLPQGWIATRNVGRAGIPGTEWSIDWQPQGGWRLEAGALWQRSRRNGSVTGSLYLPLVADVSGRLSLSREIAWGTWALVPRLSADGVGATRLALDGVAERRMPARVLARFGLVARARDLTLGLDLDNLLAVRSDAFAFGNPLGLGRVRYYTPYRPRTLSLSATRRF